MTVAEMLSRISGQELADWEAYETAHGPLGPVRGDWQAALIASTIANVNRAKKSRPAKIAEFMLGWKRGGSSDEETERVGRMLAERLGGEWTPGSGEVSDGDD
jgi:hypothetical protein